MAMNFKLQEFFSVWVLTESELKHYFTEELVIEFWPALWKIDKKLSHSLPICTFVWNLNKNICVVIGF